MTKRSPIHFGAWFGIFAPALFLQLAIGVHAHGDHVAPNARMGNVDEQPPFAGDFVDFDEIYGGVLATSISDIWSWQLLPSSLIYRTYLAGTKESRLSITALQETSDGWLLDGTLGAQVGILRYGNRHPVRPSGFQIDVEAAAHIRLDPPEDFDVRSTDYRVGVPLTYGFGNQQMKLAMYHLSSHLSDEFLIRQPGFPRLNYARDAIVLGYSVYVWDVIRLYGEVDYAYSSDISKPWGFQFGLDWAPVWQTGIHGAPFFAINGHLREEVDFGGALAVQTGWAWRGDETAHLLRMGVQYYNGKSNQFSFFDEFEQQIGAGIWYDF
jgi:hypothetical protein